MTTQVKLALITGITGQDGSYLSELLLDKGYKVYGIIRRTSHFDTTRIDHLLGKITLRYGDVQDGSGLNNYIQQIVNDNDFSILEIYNLAAQSHVQISFEIPEYTAEADAMGVVKLLEIIRSFPDSTKSKIRFYQAGTSEMFGKVLETPQSERTPFNPVSPYAAAKEYAHRIVKIYREGYHIYAVNGILFNHESPRRGNNFVTKKIINGVQDIINGKRQSIALGNLDSKRDWGHAEDYVRAMWMIMQQDMPDDYVVGTGQTWSVREFLEKAFAYHGITISWSGSNEQEVGHDQNGNVRITIDPKYYRPCEVDLLLSDPTKIRNIGWMPKYDLDTLIDDMFTNNLR